METKKSKKANLESRKPYYFNVGLVAALALVLIAFEWTISTSKITLVEHRNPYEEFTMEPIQRTDRKPPKQEPEEQQPETQNDDSGTEIEIKDNNDVDPKNDNSENLDLSSIDLSMNSDLFGEEEVSDSANINTLLSGWIPVENKPYFPACASILDPNQRDACTKKQLARYFARNQHYPPDARDMREDGMVYISFVVNQEGKVTDVKHIPVNDDYIHPSLIREAKRLVKSLPQYVPGEQRGRKVAVQHQVPISFKLR